MKIKRMITIMAAIAIVIAMQSVTAFALGSSTNGITMTLNGKIITSDVPPFIESGRTMVPVRFIGDAFDAEANWDSETGIVTVNTTGGAILKLEHGDKNILITRGVEVIVVQMDVTTIIRDGRTFVPARFIAEALGITVGWDSQTKTVSFTGIAGGAEINSSLIFKEEYEALNDELNEDGANKYTVLSISENNSVVYLSYEGLIDFINNRTGLLYFGRPACPWCRLLVPHMLSFAKSGNTNIYYYNIERDRDENNDKYKSILSLLGEYLPIDTVTQNEDDADFNPELKRVVLPQLFFIKNGEVEADVNFFQHEYLVNNETEKVMQLLTDKYAPISSNHSNPEDDCGCE